jgi:nitrite reductase (NO-forming)
VRLFVGNGGPNLSSSFHVIGEIFDRVHDVPGTYILVNHALNRALDKGAVAKIVAAGPEQPAIFDAPEMNMAGH